MKFGKRLVDERRALGESLEPHCLDYKALKQMIKPLRASLSKNAFFPSNFRPSGADVGKILVPNFSEIVGRKLLDLKSVVTMFLDVLDHEIEKLNRCYVAESERLQALRAEHVAWRNTPAGAADADGWRARGVALLQQVESLETFVSLNYTGIVKILKKKEKVTGLDIREPYLYRISMLPFSKSVSVAALKTQLLTELSPAFVAQTMAAAAADVPSAAVTSVPPAAGSFGLDVTLTETHIDHVAKRQRKDSSGEDEAVGDVRARIEAATRTPSASAVLAQTMFRPTTPSISSFSSSSINGGSISGSSSGLLAAPGTVKSVRSMSSNGQFTNEMNVVSETTALVTMTGPHGTDILGCMVTVLAKYHARILDLDLSRVHHNLTVGALIDLPHQDSDLLKELTDEGSKWHAILNYQVNNRENFILTVVCAEKDTIGATALSTLVQLLLKNHISVMKMQRLSAASATLTALDIYISIPSNVDMPAFRATLHTTSAQVACDLHLQVETANRRSKRLVVFDMDSTLIRQEVIDELAREAGVYEEVKRITEEAMQGKLDFVQSLRKRVSRLEGLTTAQMEAVKNRLELNPGALVLCRVLRKLGVKTAVVSGGFMPMALHIKQILGLDYAFANTLEMTPQGSACTGQVLGDIVDAKRKADLLKFIASVEGINKEQIVAVGDGANDLIMLGEADIGVAYHAKPIVQEKASYRVNFGTLRSVLYVMGLADEDARKLLDLPRVFHHS